MAHNERDDADKSSEGSVVRWYNDYQRGVRVFMITLTDRDATRIGGVLINDLTRAMNRIHDALAEENGSIDRSSAGSTAPRPFPFDAAMAGPFR